MVDVQYIGPHGAVELEVKPGVFAVVKQGESVQVADRVANGEGGLLEQPDNWAAKPEPKPAPKPKP